MSPLLDFIDVASQEMIMSAADLEQQRNSSAGALDVEHHMERNKKVSCTILETSIRSQDDIEEHHVLYTCM